ncbi:MAG: hypothetical protein ACRD4S_01530 [Candidatus Acidiferrales bacterium]
MYDVGLLQRLCLKISAEKDPKTIDELLTLLEAIIKDDQEELRVKLAFLAKKYANAFSESEAND